MTAVDVTVHEDGDGWTTLVTVRSKTTTKHRVRVSRAEHERFGGGGIADLVRRSFEFLLAREPNTSILTAFSLGVIERYYPEFGVSIRRPSPPEEQG